MLMNYRCFFIERGIILWSEGFQLSVIFRLEHLDDLLVRSRQLVELLLYVEVVAVSECCGHMDD